MEPYAEEMVTARILIGGFESAVERFSNAGLGSDARVTFPPLFEALNWAVAINDRIRRHRAPSGKPAGWAWRELVAGATQMAGVPFARNGAHHQWADALEVAQGLSFPMTLPLGFVTWRWRPASALPAGSNVGGESVYQRDLAGHPVGECLIPLRDAFRFVVDRLEPVGPRRAVRSEP